MAGIWIGQAPAEGEGWGAWLDGAGHVHLAGGSWNGVAVDGNALFRGYLASGRISDHRRVLAHVRARESAPRAIGEASAVTPTGIWLAIAALLVLLVIVAR